MGGTEPTTSTRWNSRTQGQRAKSAAFDNACGEIEARLIKSAGDVIKSPILVHTSTGTFAVIEPVTDASSCVMRGRSYAKDSFTESIRIGVAVAVIDEVAALVAIHFVSARAHERRKERQGSILSGSLLIFYRDALARG